MWVQNILFVCAFLTVNSQDEKERDKESTKLKEGEKKLSENVLIMLDHFKQSDPVGLPGADIPDPYHVPDMSQSVALGTMHFENTIVHGISKFRILHMYTEIDRMEVDVALRIDAIQTHGDYTMTSWFTAERGTFSVNITGLNVTTKATLGVGRDGKLRVKDIFLDLGLETITTEFTNSGFVGGMFQNIVNTGGTALFDSIKPYILKEAYAKAITQIDAKLEEFSGDIQFPNSISPLDTMIIDARKTIRDKHIDPFQIQGLNKTVSIFTVTLFNTWIMGISSFHRVGDISLKMENQTIVADFEIGTQKLEGTTQWDISAVANLVAKVGTASFSVEYIKARFIIAQALDTRKKPVLKDLNLEIGNIQVRCDGIGTMDYIIELAVNIFPNLLRYQIINTIQTPLKEKIQQEFDKLNVEDLIIQELPKLDRMQEEGFKLSSLRSTEAETDNIRDEDEFFNF